MRHPFLGVKLLSFALTNVTVALLVGCPRSFLEGDAESAVMLLCTIEMYYCLAGGKQVWVVEEGNTTSDF